MSRLRLSPEPIAGWIARQGGLAEAMAAAGTDPYVEQPEEDVLAEMPPTTTQEFRRIDVALRRGAERGWLGFWWVDALLCDVFHLHPMELYGDEYLNPSVKSVPVIAEVITLPVAEQMEMAA